jgi:hypothetical protein
MFVQSSGISRRGGSVSTTDQWLLFIPPSQNRSANRPMKSLIVLFIRLMKYQSSMTPPQHYREAKCPLHNGAGLVILVPPAISLKYAPFPCLWKILSFSLLNILVTIHTVKAYSYLLHCTQNQLRTSSGIFDSVRFTHPIHHTFASATELRSTVRN